MSQRRLGQKAVALAEAPPVHIMIATPAYDGKVDAEYAQSIAEAAFCAPLYQVKVTHMVIGNGAFIDLARNVYVKIFLEKHTDCTHLFFIDADLKFEPRAMIGLAKSGLPICAGVYPRRQTPEDYPLALASWPDGGGLWVEDDWVMCDRVPTGFLCIRRDVVEEMAKDATGINMVEHDGPVPRLFYTKIDEAGRFVGEDYCFCDDYVKKYGKKIPVWPNLDFVHGGYKGNLSAYLEGKIKAEAEASTSSAA